MFKTSLSIFLSLVILGNKSFLKIGREGEHTSRTEWKKKTVSLHTDRKNIILCSFVSGRCCSKPSVKTKTNNEGNQKKKLCLSVCMDAGLSVFPSNGQTSPWVLSLETCFGRDSTYKTLDEMLTWDLWTESVSPWFAMWSWDLHLSTPFPQQ